MLHFNLYVRIWLIHSYLFIYLYNMEQCSIICSKYIVLVSISDDLVKGTHLTDVSDRSNRGHWLVMTTVPTEGTG